MRMNQGLYDNFREIPEIEKTGYSLSLIFFIINVGHNIMIEYVMNHNIEFFLSILFYRNYQCKLNSKSLINCKILFVRQFIFVKYKSIRCTRNEFRLT